MALEHKDYVTTKIKLDQAQGYIQGAETRIGELEVQIFTLGTQIQVSHDNEAKCCTEATKFRAFYDSGHRLWGLGAIGLGISILGRHILITLAFLAALCLLIWGLSLVFPALAPFVSIGWGFVSRLWRK